MLLYDGALLATIAVVGWVILDIASDAHRRRRFASVGVLGLAALVWAVGELLVQDAASPQERLLARRVLFAGVALVPWAWVWSAWVAVPPRAPSSGRLLVVLLALPGAAVYSCLFWDRDGLFLHWYARPVERGPLFYAYAVWAWGLIAAGTARLLRASPPDERGTRLAILVSALLPTAANMEHVLLHRTLADPTPIAFGVAAVFLRWLLFDLAFASARPPVARSEMIAQMQDGVLVADPAGRVIDWNAASERIVGDTDLGGRPLDALIASLLRQRGREVEVRRFPLKRRGRRFAVGAVLADRAERRRSELRLELATRLQALGVLASGVAHEVNNPLTYLSVNLALLEPLIRAVAKPEVRTALPEPLRASAGEAHDLIADCREGAQRIQRIVEKLSQFTERGASRDAPHLHHLVLPVEKAVAMFAFGKPGRRISVSKPRSLPRVRAIPDDVVHIVLHLLINAIQMGGENVPISIELGVTRGEPWVRVSDRGPGIPEQDLPHVFDPFFTTRRPGPNIGLGLSVCWELARKNGGRLEVENARGGGAAFTLSFPAETRRRRTEVPAGRSQPVRRDPTQLRLDIWSP